MTLTLRPYQEEAIRRFDIEVARGMQRILMVSPVGSGKTILATHLIVRAVARGQRAIFVAHRREIINQTYDKLLLGGLEESQVGILMADDSRRRQGAPVQVASIDTLRCRRTRANADFFIRDEGHHAVSAGHAAVAAEHPNALHIGLTATPYRADGKGLGEVYETLVEVITMQELIELGFLVAPRIFTVAPASLPDLSRVCIRRGDYDRGQLAGAVDRSNLLGDMVEHWMLHARGVRTIAFAASVEHSKHITERFRAAGVAAEHLDGATPVDEREAILARLVRGETLVLSNVAVCTEGTDLPPVKCAILARPTKSLGLYIQQVGRILRPWESQRPIILDHAGCVMAHGLPQAERTLTLDGIVTRSGGGGMAGRMPLRTCPECYAVLPASIRACPECSHVFVNAARVPSERDGYLQELPANDVMPKVGVLRSSALDARRVHFESLRALARTKHLPNSWIFRRFTDRYGSPPPAEWINATWSAA